MMDTNGLAFSAIVTSFLLYIWHYNFWNRNRVNQGRQTPIFGSNFKQIFGLKPYHEIISGIYDKFPDARYVGFYQFLIPGLMIKDAELAKKICVEHSACFLDRRAFLPRTNDELWNRNLFALRGRRWYEMRRTLTSAFTSSKMRAIFDLVHDYSANLVAHLYENPNPVQEVEFRDFFSRFTIDVIASTAFGLDIDSVREPQNEFYRRVQTSMMLTSRWKNFKILMTILLTSFGRILEANIFDQNISDYFRNVIAMAITNRREGGRGRIDMLQLLMEAKLHREDGRELPLDNDDITSQVLLFFLGGFDTASSALCFMAYELAINPMIQDHLIREIDDYLEENDRLTYNGLNKMTYLDMVLSETLRKWPPLLVIDRRSNEPYTIEAKYSGERPVHIEKNTLIWIPVWCIHHDPKYWSEPHIFDPQRFAQENSRAINRNAFMPFGLGPRNCLGSRFAMMEIKIFFFKLLSKFRIIRTAKSEVPFTPVTHTFSLGSKNGFHFALEKRIPGHN